MAVRLETNFNRLLHRCETMAGENREGDWRLEKASTLCTLSTWIGPVVRYLVIKHSHVDRQYSHVLLLSLIYSLSNVKNDDVTMDDGRNHSQSVLQSKCPACHSVRPLVKMSTVVGQSVRGQESNKIAQTSKSKIIVQTMARDNDSFALL